MTTCKHQLLARKRITQELLNTVANRPASVAHRQDSSLFHLTMRNAAKVC